MLGSITAAWPRLRGRDATRRGNWIICKSMLKLAWLKIQRKLASEWQAACWRLG